MTRVDTLGAARSALAENPVTLLYFSGNDCGVCDAIRPKIEELLAARPRIASFEINIEASPEAAAAHAAMEVGTHIGKLVLDWGVKAREASRS